MKKSVIIIVSLILVATIGLSLFFILGNKDDTNTPQNGETTGTQNDPTNTDPDVDPTTEPTEPLPPPEIKLEMKNLKTGTVLDLTGRTPYKEISNTFPELFRFTDPNVEENLDVEPGKVRISIFTDDENSDQNAASLFVGIHNNTEEVHSMEDLEIIYFLYSGNKDWSLCGISTDMTVKQIKATLGQPSQEMDTFAGHNIEYDLEKDDHTYKIIIALDKDASKIENISLHMDNIPLYN